MTFENTLVGNANDSVLFSEVPNPSNRVPTVSSLNRDLARIGDWCKRWGIPVNPIKTKAQVISRSRILVPIFAKLVF